MRLLGRGDDSGDDSEEELFWAGGEGFPQGVTVRPNSLKYERRVSCGGPAEGASLGELITPSSASPGGKNSNPNPHPYSHSPIGRDYRDYGIHQVHILLNVLKSWYRGMKETEFKADKLCVEGLNNTF